MERNSAGGADVINDRSSLSDSLRRVDTAELRSCMRAVLSRGETPARVLCVWLLPDEDLQRKFNEYDLSATGTISLAELFAIADAAFAAVSCLGHRLSGLHLGRFVFTSPLCTGTLIVLQSY